jgi:hypothetical protein
MNKRIGRKDVVIVPNLKGSNNGEDYPISDRGSLRRGVAGTGGSTTAGW